MSQYYVGKRSKNVFDPNSKEPYVLSRTRLEAFLKCPRCFYIDRRLGVDQPPGYPFSLNAAVDTLLKKEFDIHRAKNTTHPLMEEYHIDAVPFSHKNLAEWRDAFSGVQYLDPATNFLVTGAVDDIWQNKKGELHVVDYKATAKNGQVSIDAPWQKSYKNQVEMYQWLLKKNGFTVSPVAYFVYVNGRADAEAFDGRLEFDVTIIPYQGDDSWVESSLQEAKKCLEQDTLPSPGPHCDFCLYRRSVQEALEPFGKHGP